MDKVEHYIDSDGDELWKLNGELHRDDGPAIIYSDGTQVWYRYSSRHREDGPAYIGIDNTISWYIRGIKYSFDEYCKDRNLDGATVFELKVKYGYS